MADRNSKKAIKAGIGYSVGNILVKGIAFISIPVFARLMTVEDYGIYNAYNAYAQVMLIIMGFALHSSVKNAKLDYGDRLSEYNSSVILPVIIALPVFFLIAVSFGKPLSAFLSLDNSVMIPMIVIESFSMAVITFYESVLAVDYRYKEYVGVSLAYAVSCIVLSVAFILAAPDKGYLGRALGAMLGALLIAVYGLIKIVRAAKPEYNREFWRYGFAISLPVIPHCLAQIILSQFDRMMIKKAIGNAEAGLYSFAYNVGAIFNAITAALDTAWTQWFFEQMQEKHYDRIRKTASIYCGLVAAGAVALMLISPELITLMGGKKYDSSRAAVMPILLAMFFSFMYYFPSSVEYYYKRTKLIAIGSVCAAMLNVVLNLVFIPRYGWIAAAYTTVVCYFLYYVLHLWFSYRVHGSMLYDLKRQIWIVVTVCIFTAVSTVTIDRPIIRYALLALEMIFGIVLLQKHKDEIVGFWRKIS